jgi:hypothetical protein
MIGRGDFREIGDTGTFAPLARIYREEAQPTVQRALELLRMILPLAPYVGGARATQLNVAMTAAVSSAGGLRDDPTETALENLGRNLLTAIREASDLILLGAAIDESRKAASVAATAVREAAETNAGLRQKEIDTLATVLRQDISGASERLRGETETLLAELSARGREVVTRSKKEIAGDILNDAQRQFAGAQRGLRIQVGVWSVLSVLSLGAFFAFGAWVLNTQQLPAEWTWQIAFFAGIRIIVFGGIAAAASFCLRMLKSHIALAQLNAHRTRVAHSIPSFLEVAPADRRFAILELLIQSIISTKESAIADQHPETVLTSISLLEQAAKAKKTSE